MSGPSTSTPAGSTTGVEYIFYDGHCGVCHASVRFLAARDRDGARFRFAPLGGEAFRARVSETQAAELPDSVVIERIDGTLLVRSAGTIHALRRLGGVWRVLAVLGSWVPRPLRDWAYDRFAAIRKRLMPPPRGTCPMVPPDWRTRFEA